jgi:hypothetical protein
MFHSPRGRPLEAFFRGTRTVRLVLASTPEALELLRELLDASLARRVARHPLRPSWASGARTCGAFGLEITRVPIGAGRYTLQAS